MKMFLVAVQSMEEGWLLGILQQREKLIRLSRGSQWIIRTNTCNVSQGKVKSGKCQIIMSQHAFKGKDFQSIGSVCFSLWGDVN